MRPTGPRVRVPCPTTGHDGQDSGLRLRHGGGFLARPGAQAGEDVAFRFLAAGHFPSHRTLCAFRQRHREDFGALLVALVQLARDLELTALTTLVPDGTKIRANASKRKAMSYARLQAEEARLAEEIAKLQAQAEALDAAEDAEFGVDLRGDELPEALQRREQRLATIEAARQALEERERAAGRRSRPPRRSSTGPRLAKRQVMSRWWQR